VKKCDFVIKNGASVLLTAVSVGSQWEVTYPPPTSSNCQVKPDITVVKVSY